MRLEIGSVWQHAEGMRAAIDAVGDDWIEPHGCGRWPLVVFESSWTHISARKLDPGEGYWDHVQASREIARLQTLVSERDSTIEHLSEVIRGFADSRRKG